MRRLLTIAVIIFAVSLAFLAGAFYQRKTSTDARAQQQAQTDRRICEKVNVLAEALIGIVTAPQVPDKPGQPGYAYYQEHPAERATLQRGESLATTAAAARLHGALCKMPPIPPKPPVHEKKG